MDNNDDITNSLVISGPHYPIVSRSEKQTDYAIIVIMDEADRQRRFRDADEVNTAKRANILGVRYRDMRGNEDTIDLVNGVMPVADMYKYRMVPLSDGGEDGTVVYGITLASPESHLQEINQAAAADAKNVDYNLISDSAFRVLMKRYDPPKEVVYDDVEIGEAGDNDMLDRVSQTLDEVRSDDILNYLITQADTLGASDIHLENQRENVRVRFRIDGTLHPIANLSHEKYRILFSSIASVSDLSTASTDAQSGHIVKELPGEGGQTRILNMRIETVPTSYGQDAVIRLFNFDSEMLNMDVLGLDANERRELDEIISHPRGMVMVVGPTGSGKSTTLYSIINALNDPSRKILTLEDPVEFDVPGVSQIPVDTTSGKSFADELRTVLRLDPDVVMVGEIRDNDTAKTAIQASITGHLVLATFHAQDAAAAFTRMIDMIGTNPVFATAIRLVIGQRLVRKLDDNTKIAYDPDDATKKWVRDVLNDLPGTVEKPNLDDFKLWKPGVSESDPFGYKGRIVLMEQLIVNDEIAAFLRGDEKDMNVTAIQKSAREQGMVSMLQKGVLKALAGETTLEEVNRVL